MTRMFMAAAMAAALLVPASAFAQNPFTDAVKAQLAQIKNPVTRTAEKVGEDLYAFKPTPEVRSLGQLIAHIADGNFGICGAGKGTSPWWGLWEGVYTNRSKNRRALVTDGTSQTLLYGEATGRSDIDPATKAVIDKHMPGFSSNPQIDMARSMTLKQIQQFAGDQITDDVLAKIDADLAKIPAAK